MRKEGSASEELSLGRRRRRQGSWDRAESPAPVLTCLQDPAPIQKPLEGGSGIQGVDGAPGAARRAGNGSSISTPCPARAGGASAKPSPPPRDTDGSSACSNDLGENFLWKILISLCCGLQSKEKIGHFPSSTPHSSPQGFTANIRSLDRRSISGDCALRTKTSPNIFKHFPAEVGVKRKQSTEGMLIAPF